MAKRSEDIWTYRGRVEVVADFASDAAGLLRGPYCPLDERG
jgi:hypothetical protein